MYTIVIQRVAIFCEYLVLRNFDTGTVVTVFVSKFFVLKRFEARISINEELLIRDRTISEKIVTKIQKNGREFVVLNKFEYFA